MRKGKIVYFPDIDMGWVVEERIMHQMGVNNVTDARSGARPDFSSDGLNVGREICRAGLFNVLTKIDPN